jgi:ribonucleoside-diphosphate reductase beta chain
MSSQQNFATQKLSPEPLLEENPNRYVTFPIEHEDLWKCFQTHKRLIWFVDEVDLAKDLTYWKKLNQNEKYFVKHVLAFFAASDGIVMENLAARFLNDIQLSEARSFYSVQLFMENEHSIMYSRLIDAYVNDEQEKNQLFKSIEHMPAIRQKAEWEKKWITSSEHFATRLLAFAAVEGIFFSGSFCCIYWLKERGVMPGLCMSNDFIARDEGLHCEFAILLYNNYIQNKLPEHVVHQIIGEAVEIEKQFIVESLPCSLLGMNVDMMSEYIEFISNRMLKQLNYGTLYKNAKQPFGFMDRICIESITNFFDVRETNYQTHVNDTNQVDDTFEFDNDF